MDLEKDLNKLFIFWCIVNGVVGWAIIELLLSFSKWVGLTFIS